MFCYGQEPKLNYQEMLASLCKNEVVMSKPPYYFNNLGILLSAPGKMYHFHKNPNLMQFASYRPPIYK